MLFLNVLRSDGESRFFNTLLLEAIKHIIKILFSDYMALQCPISKYLFNLTLSKIIWSFSQLAHFQKYGFTIENVQKHVT